jgi:hypothetical protein
MGAYRGEDVRRMTPEKRAWTLRRLRELDKKAARQNARQEEAKGPTVRGRPIPTG